MPLLKAPFPWFGGKSRAAHLIWPRFGDVRNYVDPFAGSLAVLLKRPHEPKNEIVNDLDCYVANAWRAMKMAPAEVAAHCDWPVNEADLHARHTWLHARAEFRERMKTDPDYFDARIAAYWIWGISCWIGANFCRPRPQHSRPELSSAKGILPRQIPNVTGGNGVTAHKVPRLTGSMGVTQKRPMLDRPRGKGISAIAAGVERKRPSVAPRKGTDSLKNIAAWMQMLATRLRFTKVVCGDWRRVVTKACTYGIGQTAILLDPPYDPKAGLDTVYGDCHSTTISAEVREWAIASGNNPLMRIALCGYEGEHKMPDDWECVAWKANGGYAAAAGHNENSHRERIWFSPHCLKCP